MTTGAQFAQMLERIARDTLRALEDIPDEVLNRPLPLPETNSIFALATHLVGAGEFWTLVLVGGREIPRDRPAEFHATGTGAALVTRYERWIAELHALLDTFSEEELERMANPAPFRAWRDDMPQTMLTCLLHAVEHSALHLGHIQLTRQMVLAGA